MTQQGRSGGKGEKRLGKKRKEETSTGREREERGKGRRALDEDIGLEWNRKTRKIPQASVGGRTKRSHA